jgi:adenylate kinase
MAPVNLVLIGPPGSGKGTQAARICERYRVPLIATGDILRAAVKAGTPLGSQVQSILSSGGLVSDAMMIDLVRERLAKADVSSGFVLDGFPRTIVQAEALDAMVGELTLRAILLDVPDAELERRLTSRRICTKCKALYTSGSIYGSEEELCSKCGSILITRDDDNIDVIRNRFRMYHSAADPLIAHYRAKGSLVTFDGTRPPDEVTDAIFRHIAGPVKKRRSAERLGAGH